MTKYIVLLFCLLALAKQIDSQCAAPECTGKVVDDKVEDTTDCSQFYFCECKDPPICTTIEPSDTPFSCGSGNFFNSTANPPDCAPELTPCVPTCSVGPTFCNVDICSSPGQCIAYTDVTNCSNYYLCSLQNNPTKFGCESPDIYFNGASCVSDEAQCCTSTLCSPYCNGTAKSTDVVDPCDCHSFYHCLDNNETPEFVSTCTSGIFDPDTLQCIPGASCTSRCTTQQCSNGVLLKMELD